MTAESMPKPDTGVHRRGSSPNWQWRIKAPKDLLSLYPTEWAHRCSLETGDLREANAKAAQLRAQWTARFAEQRRELNPQRVERVTPEMAKLLADRVSAHVLGKDELLRTDPAKAKLLLDSLRALGQADRVRSLGFPGYEPVAKSEVPMKPFDPLEGMPLSLLLELADLNEGTNMVAAQNMATQRVAAVLPLVQAEARSLGLLFDPKVPGAMDALRECLKAWRKAWQDVVNRDDGEAIDTPTAPTAVAMKQAKPTKLRDVLAQWKASKARKPQTEQAAEKAPCCTRSQRAIRRSPR